MKKIIILSFLLLCGNAFSQDMKGDFDPMSLGIPACDHSGDPNVSLGSSFGFDPTKIKVPMLKYKGFVTISELNQYSADTIADLLIQRIANKCDKSRGGDEKKSVGEYSQTMMMVNASLWDSISKYGFQNQHVTATTRGSNNRLGRFTAETNMIGSVVGYGSKSKDVLPKYTGLNVLIKQHKYQDEEQGYPPTQYGNTAVVFKNHIKNRTTFSAWDSLSVKDFRGSQMFSSMEFKDKTKDGEQFRCSRSYCEAQIWGKATMDDISYALIQEGTEVPKTFKERGIPVYLVDKNGPGSMGWKKGKILYDPKTDKEKISKAPPEIERECEKCNAIEKRINEHHNFKSWDLEKLKSRLEKEQNKDSSREILGEIVERKHSNPEAKKEFLLTQMEISKKKNDQVEMMSLLQGLVPYAKDAAVKEHIINILQGNDRGDIGYIGSWGDETSYTRKVPPIDMLVLSMAAQIEGLKDDPDVQAAILKHMQATPKNLRLLQHLLTDKSLCDEVSEEFRKEYLDNIKKLADGDSISAETNLFRDRSKDFKTDGEK
jgi:hypothetical protein